MKMSIEPYRQLCAANLPWKTFVKESEEVADITEQQKTHNLRFKGNEAKAAYEEVLQQTANAHSTTKCCRSTRTKSSKTQSDPSITLSTSKSTEQKSSDKSPKVSVNMILKAVEQRDVTFLQNHLNSENVNIADSFGWTPLMSAAYCGYSEIIELLLNLGANRRAREKSGLTAAQLALKKNYLNIVALLRKKNISVCDNSFSVNQSASSVASDEKNRQLSPMKNEQRHNSPNNTFAEKHSARKEDLLKNTSFYCEICQVNFHETTVEKHETSTLHLFNKKPKLPRTLYSISKQNKGYRILVNAGWDEEGGLGSAGQGIKYPIKTCLKLDRKGIGQPAERESRVTHFEAGDRNACAGLRISRKKPLKRKDREKLLTRETRKERALRRALS